MLGLKELLALGLRAFPGRSRGGLNCVVPLSASLPRGSIYTTTMELSPKRPSPLWFWGPNIP